MSEIALRPAAALDMPACAEIWRESINDYTGRLNQYPIPDDLGRIIRLYQHLFATDPDLFVVAERDERVVGFASAVRRDRLWFLSMCFVRPAEQARGLGRQLLEAILPRDDPGAFLATAIDSAQPISNGLYSRYGIVARLPLSSVSGYVTHPEALPELPPGISAVPFEAIAAGPPGGPGHTELTSAVNALDLELLGVEHPQDHRFLRVEGRHGFLYRDASGASGAIQGYGYASETGRIGPVAVLDERLIGPVVAHLLRAVPARGAQAVWVPGAAGAVVELLLAAGLRFEDFPILLAWNRPFADFERYVPISPGLL